MKVDDKILEGLSLRREGGTEERKERNVETEQTLGGDTCEKIRIDGSGSRGSHGCSEGWLVRVISKEKHPEPNPQGHTFLIKGEVLRFSHCNYCENNYRDTVGKITHFRVWYSEEYGYYE
jgi:hypothetical protein